MTLSKNFCKIMLSENIKIHTQFCEIDWVHFTKLFIIVFLIIFIKKLCENNELTWFYFMVWNQTFPIWTIIAGSNRRSRGRAIFVGGRGRRKETQKTETEKETMQIFSKDFHIRWSSGDFKNTLDVPWFFPRNQFHEKMMKRKTNSFSRQNFFF